MSWHLENVGTKEEVTAAIDEAVATPGGMPPVVGSILKEMVDATQPADAGYLVQVKSTGHRPMAHGGAVETHEVRVVKRGPWKSAT